MYDFFSWQGKCYFRANECKMQILLVEKYSSGTKKGLDFWRYDSTTLILKLPRTRISASLHNWTIVSCTFLSASIARFELAWLLLKAWRRNRDSCAFAPFNNKSASKVSLCKVRQWFRPYDKPKWLNQTESNWIELNLIESNWIKLNRTGSN